MRVVQSALAASAAVVLVASFTWAQSLGDVAAREQKKKKQQQSSPDGKPVKVITEEELHAPRGGNANIMGGPVADPSPKPGEGKDKDGKDKKEGEKEKTPEELKAEAEKAWREKLQKAQEEVTRLTDDVTKQQTALNDISGPLYGGGRAAQIERLEATKKQLADAQRNMDGIVEEGRRQGLR